MEGGPVEIGSNHWFQIPDISSPAEGIQIRAGLKSFDYPTSMTGTRRIRARFDLYL